MLDDNYQFKLSMGRYQGISEKREFWSEENIKIAIQIYNVFTEILRRCQNEGLMSNPSLYLLFLA